MGNVRLGNGVGNTTAVANSGNIGNHDKIVNNYNVAGGGGRPGFSGRGFYGAHNVHFGERRFGGFHRGFVGVHPGCDHVAFGSPLVAGCTPGGNPLDSAAFTLGNIAAVDPNAQPAIGQAINAISTVDPNAQNAFAAGEQQGQGTC